MSEPTATTDLRVLNASAAGPDPDMVATMENRRFQTMSDTMATVIGVRNAAIVLVEDGALWFCSRLGFLQATTPREGTLWDAAMASDEPFIVDDLLADDRFAEGPHTVGGVSIRSFASCAFHAQDGRRIGVLCYADADPVHFDDTARDTLSGLIPLFEGQLAEIHELDRAAEVQRALLPKRVPRLDGYEVAGACVPSRAVGGDFFDWYPIEGGMAFTLADVMGEGIGAGIIAATVRATIRSAKRNRDVLVAIERAAETLAQDLSRLGTFATVFHARLRATTGRTSFVDAGHGLTILLDADGTVHQLSSADLPLGTTFPGGWRRQSVTIEEGSMLVTFSDGVLGLYDGTIASVERVADIVRAASSAQEVVEEIRRLARRDGASDDVTVVAIRRTPAAAV